MRPGRGGEGSWVGSRERGRGRVETGRLLNTSEQREGVTGAVAFYSERKTEAEGRETARRSWSVLGCWEGVECIRRRPTWCSSRRRAQGWEPFARRMRRTRQALLLQCLPIVSPRAVKVGAMVNRRTWTRTLRSGRRERARRAVATRVEGRWTVVGEGATRVSTQRQRLRVCLHSARRVRVVMETADSGALVLASLALAVAPAPAPVCRQPTPHWLACVWPLLHPARCGSPLTCSSLPPQDKLRNQSRKALSQHHGP
jgi:hypothetical protein